MQDSNGIRTVGWTGGDRFFTTPEFQKRYDTVSLSLLTHKCTLVPEHFFSPEDAARMLGEVVKLGERDLVEYIRMEKTGSVLIFSNSIGETLSKAVAQTVLSTDGYQARILPEMYYLLEAREEIPEYNKIIASYADGYLHLVIGQGRSLMLANIFRAPDFTTGEYFIFNAMKKLQLNPEISTIYFRTPVSSEEEISLYRYFKSVERL